MYCIHSELYCGKLTVYTTVFVHLCSFQKKNVDYALIQVKQVAHTRNAAAPFVILKSYCIGFLGSDITEVRTDGQNCTAL